MAETNVKIKKGSGVSPLHIEDPDKEVDGVFYNGNPMLTQEQADAHTAEATSPLERLLTMHRHFDQARDQIKRGEMDNNGVITWALQYLAEGIDAQYITFQLNPELVAQGKANPGFDRIELIKKEGVYVPLEEQGTKFFDKFRELNTEFQINYSQPSDRYHENLELTANQLPGAKRVVDGDAFTFYFQPGIEVEGVVQAIQTKKIGSQDAQFVQEWVLLADTLFSDLLGVTIAGQSQKQACDVESMFGMSTEEMTGSYIAEGYGERTSALEEKKRKGWVFYNEGSYFDLHFDDVREGLTNFCGGFRTIELDGTEKGDLSKAKYEKAIRFIEDVYQTRPGLNIGEEEVQKDLNSAKSLARLIRGLFDNYKQKIAEDFEVPGYGAIDTEDLAAAAMFTGAMARAIKYMPKADGLPRIDQIRKNNDIREMTGYMSQLIEASNGEFTYYGEPLVSKKGKPSRLGAAVMYITDKVDPNREGHFVVDLIEKAIEYEERVQDSTSSPAQPIYDALKEMYLNCDKSNLNELRAIHMIDTMVNPKGKDVYRTLKKK